MIEIYKENKKKGEEKYQKINQVLDKCLEIVSGVGLATATSSLLTMGMDNNSLMAMTAGTVILSPVMYFGVKKVIKILDDKIYQSTLAATNDFDIEDSNEYFRLIKRYNDDPWYIENGYDDPKGIAWDVDFLKSITKVIVRDHRDCLLQSNEDYTNYNLVSSLVNETIMCALENSEDIIGPEIIISSIKTWDYIPQEVKKQVVDTVIIEEGLEQSLNPYQECRGGQKIIQFRPKTNK